MFTKDEIINGMCQTHHPFFDALSRDDQDVIKSDMEQIYLQNFEPVLLDVFDDARCGCEQCVPTVIETLGRALGKQKYILPEG